MNMLLLEHTKYITPKLSMTSHIDKARQRPIEGPYKEFAKEIRLILGWSDGSNRQHITTRAAMEATTLSNKTIANMSHGMPTKAVSIDKFVRGLGGDADKLKLLAGIVPPSVQNRYTATITSDDPLSRIGREYNPSVFGNLPLADTAASAGIGITGTSEESRLFGEVLSSEIRTIEVSGDCMEPFFHNGDMLFIKPSNVAENGEKVIALLGSEIVACKVYRNVDNKPHLEAANGNYPKITSDFKIIGIVKGSYRP